MTKKTFKDIGIVLTVNGNTNQDKTVVLPGKKINISVYFTAPETYDRPPGQVFLLLPSDFEYVSASETYMSPVKIVPHLKTFTGQAAPHSSYQPHWVDPIDQAADPCLLAAYQTRNRLLDGETDATNQGYLQWDLVVKVKSEASGDRQITMWFMDSNNKVLTKTTTFSSLTVTPPAPAAPELHSVTLTGAVFQQSGSWWLGAADNIGVKVAAKADLPGPQVYLRWKQSNTSTWNYVTAAGQIDLADQKSASFGPGALKALTLADGVGTELQFELALTADQGNAAYGTHPVPLQVKRDAKAPTLSGLAVVLSGPSFILSGRYSDTESGVKKIEYSLDGGSAWQDAGTPATGTISHTLAETDFRKGILVRATDKVDNVSSGAKALIDAQPLYDITWPDYTDAHQGSLTFAVTAQAKKNLLLPIEASEIALPAGLERASSPKDKITKTATVLDLSKPAVEVANETLQVSGAVGTPISQAKLTLSSAWFKNGKAEFTDPASRGKFQAKTLGFVLPNELITNTQHITLDARFTAAPDQGKKLSFRYKIESGGTWKNLPAENLTHQDGAVPFTVRLPFEDFAADKTYPVFLQAKYGDPSPNDSDYTTEGPVDITIDNTVPVIAESELKVENGQLVATLTVHGAEGKKRTNPIVGVLVSWDGTREVPPHWGQPISKNPADPNDNTWSYTWKVPLNSVTGFLQPKLRAISKAGVESSKAAAFFDPTSLIEVVFTLDEQAASNNVLTDVSPGDHILHITFRPRVNLMGYKALAFCGHNNVHDAALLKKAAPTMPSLAGVDKQHLNYWNGQRDRELFMTKQMQPDAQGVPVPFTLSLPLTIKTSPAGVHYFEVRIANAGTVDATFQREGVYVLTLNMKAS